jgi:uncharacterized protein YjbJ (UPF0337 family)
MTFSAPGSNSESRARSAQARADVATCDIGSRRSKGTGGRIPSLVTVILEQMETEMSGTTDKLKGLANEAAGKAKQGIGELSGSEKLQAEGAAQEAKGDAQQAVGDAKNATKDAIDKTADTLKKPL